MKIELEGVQKTLLIPLSARAYAMKQNVKIKELYS